MRLGRGDLIRMKQCNELCISKGGVGSICIGSDRSSIYSICKIVTKLFYLNERVAICGGRKVNAESHGF